MLPKSGLYALLAPSVCRWVQRFKDEANIAEREALYQFLSDLLILEQSIAYFPFMDDDAAIRIHDLEAKLQGHD